MSDAPAGTWHQPVMAAEVLDLLRPQPGAVLVDGTVGTGGHSLLLLARLLPNGRVIAIDRDPQSLDMAQRRLIEFAPQLTCVHENYRQLPSILGRLGLSRVDGVLLDLGLSSAQLERVERGFSFLREGPLDMRFDPSQPTTAAQLVNTLPIDELATILRTFGEERFASRIARRIVDERRRHPITTTTQLAHLITRTVSPGARYGRLHPATRTFQALRIIVNDELGALESCVNELPNVLAPHGRAAIITFHSLEDRIVKRRFLEGQREGFWTVLTAKPLRPTAEEMARNPRARSAKLRAVERR